jgi:hypothetical protein
LTSALVDTIDPLIRHFVETSAFSTEEEMNRLIHDAKTDMENPNYHFYVDMYVTSVIQCVQSLQLRGHGTQAVGCADLI